MKISTIILILAITTVTGCAGRFDTPTLARGPLLDAAASVGAFEQKLENAAATRDVRFLEQAFAPTLFFTHAGGTSEGRAALLAAFRAPATPARRTLSRIVDRTSRRIEIHGDIALTRGKILVRRISAGRETEYTVQYVRLYRLSQGRWQLLSHHTVGEIKSPT